MLLAVFSFKKNQRTGEGWVRTGSHIIYEKSDFAFKQNSHEVAYTLSFEIAAEEEDDTILVAPVPPYTYTRLTNTLKELQRHFDKR